AGPIEKTQKGSAGLRRPGATSCGPPATRARLAGGGSPGPAGGGGPRPAGPRDPAARQDGAALPARGLTLPPVLWPRAEAGELVQRLHRIGASSGVGVADGHVRVTLRAAPVLLALGLDGLEQGGLVEAVVPPPGLLPELLRARGLLLPAARESHCLRRRF